MMTGRPEMSLTCCRLTLEGVKGLGILDRLLEIAFPSEEAFRKTLVGEPVPGCILNASDLDSWCSDVAFLRKYLVRWTGCG